MRDMYDYGCAFDPFMFAWSWWANIRFYSEVGEEKKTLLHETHSLRWLHIMAPHLPGEGRS